jgi:hypothetical protein
MSTARLNFYSDYVGVKHFGGVNTCRCSLMRKLQHSNSGPLTIDLYTISMKDINKFENIFNHSKIMKFWTHFCNILLTLDDWH